MLFFQTQARTNARSHTDSDNDDDDDDDDGDDDDTAGAYVVSFSCVTFHRLNPTRNYSCFRVEHPNNSLVILAPYGPSKLLPFPSGSFSISPAPPGSFKLLWWPSERQP